MYLLDTDFLFAFFFKEQSTHLKAKKIMENIEENELYVSNIVLQELATVLSNKQSQVKARMAIANCKLLDLQIIKMTDKEEQEVWLEFNKIEKDKTSFIDCSNLYLAKSNGYKIASFDTFYPSHILVKA